MRVRDERLGALGGPLHGAVELLGRPGDHDILGIEVDLRAEAAANVGRDHAHLVLGQPQHEGRHQQPLDVRVLARDIERVPRLGARVRRVGRARLDRVRYQAVVDEIELGDVRRPVKRAVDRCLVTQRPDVAGVVRRRFMNRRRAFGPDRVDHCRQNLVIHLDHLSGIPRLGERFGDHHRDALPDMPHLALRERRVRRLLHRLAVDIGDQPAAGQAAHLRRRQIGARIDRKHRRGFFCMIHENLFDPGMRVRRSHERRVRLPRQRDIVGIHAGAGEEAVILLALDPRPDQRCRHSLPPIARAPAMMLLTILW